MAYRFEPREPFGDGVRRLAERQLIRIEAAMHAPATDTVQAVFETRKALKKLRALLALVRSGLGRRSYRDITKRLRDLGRALSRERDDAILVAALETLANDADADGVALIRRIKSVVARSLLPRTVSRPTVARLGMVGGMRLIAPSDVAALRTAIAALDTDHIEAAEVWRGAGRVYRRVRKAIKKTTNGDDPDIDRLHHLRKVMQRHARHLQLLSVITTPEFSAHMISARTISQLLGEHNDMAVLRRSMVDGHTRAISIDVRSLCVLIDKRQADLRFAALAAAKNVSLLTRSAFECELENLWSRAVEGDDVKAR
jgi:CHAD domain-containing protein